LKVIKSFIRICITLILIVPCSCDKEGPETVTLKWIDSVNGELFDPINEQEYNVIKIGNQVWFAENLKATRYANDDIIPDGTNIGELSFDTPADYRFSYDDDPGNAEVYGYLYTWSAVEENRNVCPEGWHVPSELEWTELRDYFGGTSGTGGVLKEQGFDHWNDPNQGATNESGFSALPGGIRINDGTFQDLGKFGLWWSSTLSTEYHAWYQLLSSTSSNTYWWEGIRNYGLSVRCVQD